jgi:hypothetical protein
VDSHLWIEATDHRFAGIKTILREKELVVCHRVKMELIDPGGIPAKIKIP